MTSANASKQWRRRALTLVQRPIVTGLVVAFLFYEVASIAFEQPYTSVCGEAIGEWLNRYSLGPVRRHCCIHPEYDYVVRRGDQLELIDESEAMSITSDDPAPPIGSAYVIRRTKTWGFWSPTRAIQSTDLVMHEEGGGFTPSEQMMIRREYVKRHSEWRHLAAGDHQFESILWTGWAHTAFTAGALALFAISLAWVDTLPAEWKRTRRLRRNHCPTCNYDLRGNPSAPCPECGWCRPTLLLPPPQPPPLLTAPPLRAAGSIPSPRSSSPPPS